MILYLITSILFFIIIFSVGFFLFSLVERTNSKPLNYSFISIYFAGFAILSIVTSYLSIFIAINKFLTLGYAIFCVLGLIFFRKELINYLSNLKKLSIVDIGMIVSIILFIAFISAEGIFNYDSGLYHVQAIKWISEYPVVPGLGNLHGRFAFNSLFFSISAAFSENHVWGNHEILIFPINALSFTVFLLWQYFQVKTSILNKDLKSIVFPITIVLLCFHFLTKWISSPSPDIVCTIIIITIFQWIAVNKMNRQNQSMLIISLVFVCISYKLSSALLILIFLLFIRKKSLFKDLMTISCIGMIVMLPFLIRNYYLSGYLIYPFPDIDIFNVDWKIPLDKVINAKLWIESWAKIPGKSYHEVMNLAFLEWVSDWYMRKDFLTKLILFTSFSLPFIGVRLYLKKEFIPLPIGLIIFFNLLFWLLQAPDPRFIYGLLFFSFAYFLFLTISLFSIKTINTTVVISFIGLVLVGAIAKKSSRAMVSYYDNKNQFFIPENFEVLPDQLPFKKQVNNFEYFTPASGDRCFNHKIPCAPYPNKDLVLRGDNLKDGFRVKHPPNKE